MRLATLVLLYYTFPLSNTGLLDNSKESSEDMNGVLNYLFSDALGDVSDTSNSVEPDSVQQEILPKLSDDLENWMTNLPQYIKECFPINTLAIPGSHDSFTRKMTKDFGAAPEMHNYTIIYVFELLGPEVRGWIVNWLKTQDYSPTEQLMAGIRYFDLRIATMKDSDEFFIVHGWYAEEVLPIFDELLTFLESHPKELIILDCQEFYGLKDTHHKRFIQILYEYFGNKAVKYVPDMSTITLDYLTEQNSYQVIIVYREDKFASTIPFLWPSGSFPNSWLDTLSQDDLFNNMDNDIGTRNFTSALIAISIITPDPKFILSHVGSTIEKECQVPLQESMLNWLSKQTPGIGGFNIVITNFVNLDDNAFSKSVVDLNMLLSQQQCLA